jgi:hypothetical protein
MESAPALSVADLARLAEMLGHDTPQVLDCGSLPWVAALQSAPEDDLGPGLTFLVFLLVLAISTPKQGAETLFERSFEAVHRALERSNLPWEGFRMLTRHLPPLSWWDNWDNCRRLRVAVARAYIEEHLDPHSFRRLTSDSRLYETLVSAAENVTGGRRFLNQVPV